MPEQVPITIGFWLLALVPLAALLILLVGLRWTAAQAGALGFFIAAIIALFVFQAGFQTVAVATAKGIWDAIFILYVVWPALLLYEVTDKAGAFSVMRTKLEQYTKSRLLLVLAIGWVFASFLQGIAGFGTPIAIVAPLLVGVGVNPIMAVVIPLVGHAWANMFGTLAVGWLATIRVVDLINPTSTAFIAALFLWVVNLLGGLTIAWLYGRWRAVVLALPAVAIISLIHGGGELLLTTVNPIISNFVPATVALGAMFGITFLPYYREAEPVKSQIFEGEKGKEAADGGEPEEPKMSVHAAFLPYYTLIAVSLAGLLITPLNNFLGQVEVGFPYPRVETGFGAVTPAEEVYGGFEVFTHPGTFLLIAVVVGYAFYKLRGKYENGIDREIPASTAENAVPASIAILGFLTLSKIMDHAGMTEVLALGIAVVSPPALFAFLSNFIGILGAFMTSSNTASNILFAPLQSDVARATVLNQALVVGAQSAGGAIGNAIAPANVVLGTGTAKIIGQEGTVLRYTLPWSILVGVLVGAVAVAIYAFT